MRRALLVALPLAVVLALAIWRSNAVAPRDASAPPREFSSARAQDVLRDLLREGVPHPVGSIANMRVRDRIVARFQSLGYETTVQRRFACNAGAACANVENIIARRPGARGSAVWLAAHYDSVGAGTGASDDTMGVAVLLEVARALRGETLRNPVAFLVTDGEEAGLLGAEAFASDANLMRDVGVVINVENRGTFGASSMFETSAGNRWLARHLANALPHPQASSLFYAIYTLLPNDTDVTVFKREGKAAVNFAAIRGVSWYHTPFDDVAHASPRTVQHHGENLLATTRVLADADLDARSSSDATYFDILGFTLVWWPQEWTLWIAVVSLLLLVAAARRVPPRAMTFGVLTAFVAIAFAGIGGYAISWLARLRSADANWVATPTPSIAAMWLIGLAAALFAAALFAKKSDPLPMLYGIAIVWHTIGIALAATMLGGAAFLFVVPAVALTICALVRMKELATSVVAVTVGAVLLFPLCITLYEALGGRLMASMAVLIGILATFVAPLFATKRNAAIVAMLAIICAIVAIALPTYTSEKPQRINIVYVDDPAMSPRYETSTLTPGMREAAQWAAADRAQTPWNTSRGWATPAPPRNYPRPIITQESIAGGVRVRVQSQRHPNRITLVFRGGTVQRVNGVALPPKSARFRDRASEWQFAQANGVGEMVVDIATTNLRDVVASDMTFGLPSPASVLVDKRNLSPAFPSQDGDATVVRSRLK